MYDLLEKQHSNNLLRNNDFINAGFYCKNILTSWYLLQSDLYDFHTDETHIFFSKQLKVFVISVESVALQRGEKNWKLK